MLAEPLLLVMIGSIFGACLGSFLNVVINRYLEQLSDTPQLPAGLGGRSMCPHCHQTLRWWELVPVISYVALKGRCARCHKPIARQYVLVELGMAVAAVWLVLALPPVGLGSLLALLCQLALVSMLVVLALIDLRSLLLPDRYVVVLGVFVALCLALDGRLLTLSTLAGILVGAGSTGLLFLATCGRGIGLGDVKLMIPLGAYFAFPDTIMLLLLAFWAGGIVGLILLLSKKANLKTAIPFGPFLIAAALVLMMYPAIAPWFFGLVWL